MTTATPPLAPHRTAVLLIDLMPRIIALPSAPYTGPEVLARSLRIADAVRRVGGTVAFVRVERPGADDQPPGSGFAPECVLHPGDIEIVKRTMGAFHNTNLDATLRDRDIDTVILVGLVTNFGVESTGRSADEHDYRVVFVDDAMSGAHAHAHEFAVEYVFPRIGTVARTDKVIAGLSGSH